MSDYQVLQDPEMLALYASAEREGLWFHCYYQDLWFSPAELRAHQGLGKFCWGPVNWTLRNPAEFVRQLECDLASAERAVAELRKRIADDARRAGSAPVPEKQP